MTRNCDLSRIGSALLSAMVVLMGAVGVARAETSAGVVTGGRGAAAAAAGIGSSAVGARERGGAGAPGAGDPISLFERSVVGQFVTVLLDNGDVLRGTVVGVEQGAVTLQHAVLGEVMIPTTRISEAYAGAVTLEFVPRQRGPGTEGRTAPIPGGESPEEIAEGDPVGEAEAGIEEVTAEAPKKERKIKWVREVELGLTGSQGNVERANVQAGVRIAASTETDSFQFNARYNLNTTRGETTANRLLANVRQDWGLADPDWSVFLQSGAEWDEFRDFDVRWTGGGGFGYQFLANEKTSLRGRLGFGFARDFGSPTDEDYNPEVILAMEMTHRLNKRQQVIASAELFPGIDDIGQFRSILKGEWQLRIADTRDVFLRMGVEYRYDTGLETDTRSDVDYFARLVFGF